MEPAPEFELLEAENETDLGVLCQEDSQGEYSVPLHIASLFVLLIVSSIGVFLPITVKRCFSKSISKENVALIAGKFFGSGVMVGTAFIHILPASVESLSNECLPEFFIEGYPAFPYLIAMVSALLLHLIEWVTVSMSTEPETDKDPDQKNSKVEEAQPQKSHGHGHAHHTGQDLVDYTQAKYKIATIMIEVAIGVHSVVIGVALGLAKEELVTLWIALSFHQFFEGMGMGFRISEVKSYTTRAAFFNGGIFAVTTPIGVAIGIGIHSSSSGVQEVIAEGVFEAIASGLLLYSALVSMTAEEFGLPEFQKMRRWRKVVSFGSFYLGAATMSIIGIWA